jgi:hypothetical protein
MEETIYKIGFWSVLVAFIAAFGFDVAQILAVKPVQSLRQFEIKTHRFALF